MAQRTLDTLLISISYFVSRWRDRFHLLPIRAGAIEDLGCSVRGRPLWKPVGGRDHDRGSRGVAGGHQEADQGSSGEADSRVHQVSRQGMAV